MRVGFIRFYACELVQHLNVGNREKAIASLLDIVRLAMTYLK
jgi:hypothetical protein